MQALNENAADPRPALMRFLVPSWEYSRPRISAHVHFAIGAIAVGVVWSAAVAGGSAALPARLLRHDCHPFRASPNLSPAARTVSYQKSDKRTGRREMT